MVIIWAQRYKKIRTITKKNAESCTFNVFFLVIGLRRVAVASGELLKKCLFSKAASEGTTLSLYART